jgi:hypothetical protein
MEFTGLCSKDSAHVSVCWVHSLAAHFPTHTAMSNKVSYRAIYGANRELTGPLPRIRRPRITLWPVLPVGRSRPGQRQRLHGVATCCRCENSD